MERNWTPTDHFSHPAGRIPPPWQHPDPPDWYTQPAHHSVRDHAQILAATENLVPFSKAQPEIFKTDQLRPAKDLKVLARDYAVSD